MSLAGENKTMTQHADPGQSLPPPSSAPARPIFVVGSPRSGTSVLTWSLAQHPNILVQEESVWMGPLAYQMELAYRLGTARGERSQLSALGVSRSEYFRGFGQAIHQLILEHRRDLEARGRKRATPTDAQRLSPVLASSTSGAFQISRAASDPKARWVDGTPEYSFYIYPLVLLFPQARFIHLVRQVGDVVRSMLTFERTGGPPLVESEQAAYDYWLRAVRACREAERALGSSVVCRLHHDDLTRQPESSLRRVLRFLEEPFAPQCLEPLRERINSSNVPRNFDPSDAKTDRLVVEEACRLNSDVMQPQNEHAPAPEVLARLEKAFGQRADELAHRLAPPQK